MTIAGAARGQDAAAIQEAEARFRDGLRDHDAGREEAARLRFTEAYAVLHTPSLLFNLARSEQLTGRTLEALVHFRQFVADSDPRIAPADRDAARAHIAELLPRIGHVRIDAPAHATVDVDGMAVPGESPFAEAIDVTAGTHTVRARIGDEVKTLQVDAPAGITTTARFEPEAPPPAPPPAPREAGTWLTPKHVTAIALAGGALVAGAVGVAFALKAGSDSDTADAARARLGSSASACSGPSPPGDCATLADAVSAHKTDTALEAGFLVGGGALALGAVATWLLWPERGAGAALWIAPQASPTVAGLRLGGRF